MSHRVAGSECAGCGSVLGPGDAQTPRRAVATHPPDRCLVYDQPRVGFGARRTKGAEPSRATTRSVRPGLRRSVVTTLPPLVWVGLRRSRTHT